MLGGSGTARPIRNGSPFSRLTQVISMCAKIICVHI